MKIILIGSEGKMGKAFFDYVSARPQDQVVACVDISYEGIPTKQSCNKENSLNSPKYGHKNIWSVEEKADIAVDFSTSNDKKDLIDYALKNKLALAIFSTTCSAEDNVLLQKASHSIPVLVNKNASIGVNLIYSVLPTFAKKLKNADVIVTEYHHKNKLDSPSGTAKQIVNILSQNNIENIDTHVIRAGTEKGYHKIEFILDNEVITLSHRASSKDIFVKGAYLMAHKLLNYDNGLFESLQ